MAIIKQKHCYFYKEWFVFPFAVMWESDLREYIKPTHRLTIHFLWWHWRWTFVKENKNVKD